MTTTCPIQLFHGSFGNPGLDPPEVRGEGAFSLRNNATYNVRL